MSDAKILEKLKEYLTKKGALLCPFRLDADYDIGLSNDAIWRHYGCIKELCSAWKGTKCKL